jgi:hypothetical protein
MGMSATGTTAARRSVLSGAISYSASKPWPELMPKFQIVPSGSTLGWAEKGMPGRSGRQVFTPSVSSVRASMRVAEPPSHNASTSPCTAAAGVGDVDAVGRSRRLRARRDGAEGFHQMTSGPHLATRLGVAT